MFHRQWFNLSLLPRCVDEGCHAKSEVFVSRCRNEEPRVYKNKSVVLMTVGSFDRMLLLVVTVASLC